MALAKRPPSRSEGRRFFAGRACRGEEALAVAAAGTASPPATMVAFDDDHRVVPADSGAAAARSDGGLRMGSVTSYEWLNKIGQGAFGAVWKARHRPTGEEVAVKSLHAGGDGLLREAAMLSACAGNPAVVELREVARGAGDDLHLVMEFVGPSLHDAVAARRRGGRAFKEAEARRVTKRLMRGVESMHGRGVVHCDLKPGNVLVGRQGGGGRVIKICDLGLARSAAAPPPDSEELKGTLWYMAPEQLLGDKDCGAPVDMWSLGCVMAELVAGRPIFKADTVHEQVAKIVNLLGIPDEVSLMPLGVSSSAPSQLRDVVPEQQLSQAGFDVLRGLLEFDPKDRLTAAAALQMPWFAKKDDDDPSTAGKL
ncbi:hypothetical protein ACP70R_046597 [Stipagrostis hirtigluma subsp. patula]